MRKSAKADAHGTWASHEDLPFARLHFLIKVVAQIRRDFALAAGYDIWAAKVYTILLLPGLWFQTARRILNHACESHGEGPH